MGITTGGHNNKSIVIYLDDIAIFYKKHFDHLQHLNHVFKRCRKYGISLNSKKHVFLVIKGKSLGHIISKDGMMVDSKKMKSIM